MRSAAPPRGAPRLIDLTWGEANHPRVTLVGKGVCFDTGGLDIKPDILHAQHEEGHGRRGDGAGARAHDHGAQTEACGCAC